MSAGHADTQVERQVTLEINTDPPPLDLPGPPMKTTFKGEMSMDELADTVQNMSFDFKLSPELME